MLHTGVSCFRNSTWIFEQRLSASGIGRWPKQEAWPEDNLRMHSKLQPNRLNFRIVTDISLTPKKPAQNSIYWVTKKCPSVWVVLNGMYYIRSVVFSLSSGTCRSPALRLRYTKWSPDVRRRGSQTKLQRDEYSTLESLSGECKTKRNVPIAVHYSEH